MSVPSFATDPEFFKVYRSNLETMEPDKFEALLGLVRGAVDSEPSPFYASPLDPGVQSKRPGDFEDAVLMETDGPLRLPDGRISDIRLFAEHSRERGLGILAFAGTDWKPTQDPSEITSSEALVSGLLNGGVVITADIGTIDNLWMLSADGGDHWVMDFEEGRVITDFEYDQLAQDLSTLQPN